MTTLTRTRDALVNRALSKLQVVGSGQSPAAEDAETVDDTVDALILQLSADGIVEVNADEIPNEIFEDLASLLANLNALDFGKAFSADAKTFHEREIRRRAASQPTYETLRSTYF